MDEQTELTQLHGKVIDALNFEGIDHLDEWELGVEGEQFELDCYLPNYHAAIEADGPSHGMRGKKDARRDALLLTIGIPTLRISWRVIEKESVESLGRHIRMWVAGYLPSRRVRRDLMPSSSLTGIKRVPREPCTCPDEDCLRHADIGGL